MKTTIVSDGKWHMSIHQVLNHNIGFIDRIFIIYFTVIIGITINGS